MRRIAPLQVVAAGVTLGLAATLVSACSLQWSAYAAKVGGTTISPAQLDSAMSHATGDKPFRCLLETAEKNGRRFEGAGSNTYDSGFAAYVLSNLVNERLAADYGRSHGIVETSRARTLASDQVDTILATELASSDCGDSSSALLDGLGRELTSSLTGVELVEDELATRAAHVSFTSSGLTSYEKAHRESTEESCLEGIITTSKSTADTVERELKTDKKSFASLAKKYDTTSTGEESDQLGCYTYAQLKELSSTLETSIHATPTGSITSVVSYQSAYLVMLVTSRPLEPSTDLLQTILTSYGSTVAHDLAQAEAHAPVQVDPRYGTWKAHLSTTSEGAEFGGEVEPPKGPPAADLLNTNANKGKLHKAPSTSDDSDAG